MSLAQQKQPTRRVVGSVAASQLDLFAASRPPASLTAATSSSALSIKSTSEIDHDRALRQTPNMVRKAPEPLQTKSDIRVTTTADMPVYSDFDRQAVERSLATLPPTKVWFTYAAVRESFGISRATVARRVKEGLVPGIRFRGANVLEDGAVRRFDREQLLWLLLAVRTSRLLHVERSVTNSPRRCVPV